MDTFKTRVQRTRQSVVRGLVLLAAVATVAVATVYILNAGRVIEVREADVAYQSVREATVQIEVEGVGKIVSQNEWQVSAPMSARVIRVHQVAGDSVAAGEALVELDCAAQVRDVQAAYTEWLKAKSERRRSDLEFQLAEAEGRSQAEALDLVIEEARLEAEARARLADDGLISQSELKAARFKLSKAVIERDGAGAVQRAALGKLGESRQEADLRVTTAQAALVHAESAAEECVVRASRSGVLQETPVQVGEFVAQGAVVARLVDIMRWSVTGEIASGSSERLAVGQAATVASGAQAVVGRVARVSQVVKDGAVAVTIEPEDQSDVVSGAKVGESVNIRIRVGYGASSLALPRAPWMRSGAKQSVFVMHEPGLARRRLVQFGATSADLIEVVEGLVAGDRIIARGLPEGLDIETVRLR